MLFDCSGSVMAENNGNGLVQWTTDNLVRSTPTRAGYRAISKALPTVYERRLKCWREVFFDHLENSRPPQVSRIDQIKALFRGYTQELYYMYGFTNGVAHDDYLNEVSRLYTKYLIEDSEILSNKYKFHQYMNEKGLNDYLPSLYGTIRNGKFQSDNYESIEQILVDKKKCVLKGLVGGGGKKVYICSFDNGDPILRGKGGSEFDFKSKVKSLENAIVTEYCIQDGYIGQIFSRSTNTIRAIVIHPDGSKPFIAGAAQRIGSEQSSPLDNFYQKGLAADIDLETGKLGAAAQRTDSGKLEWHDNHPITGKQIKGVEIPRWKSIRSELLKVTSEADELKYIGWDIVVTSPGKFKIVEGNHFPNPRNIQVHQPLLEDSRVRKFFKENGVKV